MTSATEYQGREHDAQHQHRIIRQAYYHMKNLQQQAICHHSEIILNGKRPDTVEFLIQTVSPCRCMLTQLCKRMSCHMSGAGQVRSNAKHETTHESSKAVIKRKALP